MSSPPFEGPPNAVQLTWAGAANTITEGGGPTVPRTLPVDRRITIGDLSCTSLARGGVDCQKGDAGFRFVDDVLTVRGKDSSPSVTTTGAVDLPSATVQGPPMDGPYTEGTTPAAPGTACGAATGDIVVTVVSGSISCTDALATMKAYDGLPKSSQYGDANIRQFDGWQCSATTYAMSRELGYGAKCSKGDITLTRPI